MVATKAEAPDFRKGNSQLLMDFREAVLKAYRLGEDIKEIYGIVPPKVLADETWCPKGNHITIGLVVN